MSSRATVTPAKTAPKLLPHFDWLRIARLMLVSRAMDEIEETEFFPARKIIYQFSARGHELIQVLLGTLLTHPHDAAGAYYRSRPFLLTLGLTPEDSFASNMARCGGPRADSRRRHTRPRAGALHLVQGGWARRSFLHARGRGGSCLVPQGAAARFACDRHRGGL